LKTFGAAACCELKNSQTYKSRNLFLTKQRIEKLEDPSDDNIDEDE